jgi:hypothetical protein
MNMGVEKPFFWVAAHFFPKFPTQLHTSIVTLRCSRNRQQADLEVDVAAVDIRDLRTGPTPALS